jgi:hypothetical protein
MLPASRFPQGCAAPGLLDGLVLPLQAETEHKNRKKTGLGRDKAGDSP